MTDQSVITTRMTDEIANARLSFLMFQNVSVGIGMWANPLERTFHGHPARAPGTSCHSSQRVSSGQALRRRLTKIAERNVRRATVVGSGTAEIPSDIEGVSPAAITCIA